MTLYRHASVSALRRSIVRPNAHGLCQTHTAWREKRYREIGRHYDVPPPAAVARDVPMRTIAMPIFRNGSLVRQIGFFLTELGRWELAGRPVRSDARVEEIFETICKPCEFFVRGKNADAGECGVCHCALKASGGHLNKLRWATTQCPTTPPRWKAEAELETNGTR